MYRASLIAWSLSLLAISFVAEARDSSASGTPAANVAPVANPCPRPPAGSAVQNPPALLSRNGVLTANFSYQTIMDDEGRTLFCFMTPDGKENPTLSVRPGDHIRINVTNNTPAAQFIMQIDSPNCGDTQLTGSSLNIHLHGTNTSPKCHEDQVIKTMINSGQSFAYDLQIPADEPPGLYWYHPHAHMLTESALPGGGSGAIIVQGIEKLQPAVAGLRQQVLVIRDQPVAGNPEPGGNVPSWDVTVNNIPIAYPAEIPAVIRMSPGEQQLWRVSNSSADTILDLQVQFDGKAQTLKIVGLDGVPTGSQDGTRKGKIVKATDILIPTAGRAEFIVTGPSSRVSSAKLVTLAINTGPDGDNDPQRTLATIEPSSGGEAVVEMATEMLPSSTGGAWKQRFDNLRNQRPDTKRTLFFSEDNPESQFFITEEGETPVLFNPNNPPAIVTTQGSVEDWTIENRSLENHEFHLHQIHFLVLAQNHFQVNGTKPPAYVENQLLDTIQTPFWDGNPKHPFPSVKLRMDFRGTDVGDFVYHCHIAEHEDDGMMAIIRVMPSQTAAVLERLRLQFVNWWSPYDAAPLPAWCIRGRASDGARARRLSNAISSR